MLFLELWSLENHRTMFNKHTSLKFMKITLLWLQCKKAFVDIPHPPTSPTFLSWCQEEMNSVFERFTHIRCGPGSSPRARMSPAVCIWTVPNRGCWQLSLLQCLTAVPESRGVVCPFLLPACVLPTLLLPVSCSEVWGCQGVSHVLDSSFSSLAQHRSWAIGAR